jgi:hypothetical protein
MTRKPAMKVGKSLYSVAIVLTVAVRAILPIGLSLKGKNIEQMIAEWSNP